MLERHFEGRDRGAIRGVHVVSTEEKCKLVIIDFDVHDDDGKDLADANWRMALSVFKRAKKLGFATLLFDSNGAGGFHVWLVMADLIPARLAWQLGQWLTLNYASYGLPKRPESFPKRPKLSGLRCGNWVRLPGRHHTRDFWTRVWSGRRWLEGEPAIRAILRVRGTPVDVAALIPKEFGETEPRTPKQRRDPPRKTACSAPKSRAELARDVARARDALLYLGDYYYNDYHSWIRVGMALSELGDAGLELWSAWSSRSDKYDPDECEAKWRTFEPGRGITLGSLFAMAQFEGWTGRSLRHSFEIVLKSKPRK
jgi:hypothetical protein